MEKTKKKNKKKETIKFELFLRQSLSVILIRTDKKHYKNHKIMKNSFLKYGYNSFSTKWKQILQIKIVRNVRTENFSIIYFTIFNKISSKIFFFRLFFCCNLFI